MKPSPRNDYIKLCQKLKRPNTIDFGREYDQLLKHKLIKSVLVENDNLVVNTKLITVKYKKSIYALGEFKIKFEIVDNSIYGTPYFKNITGFIMKKSGNEENPWYKIYHHPHIMECYEDYSTIDYENEQDACLGNIFDLVEDLKNRRNIAGLIYVYLNFLQSYQGKDYYNREDDNNYEAYIEVTKWPKVRTKTKKKKR
jgi:hypothetical protein